MKPVLAKENAQQLLQAARATAANAHAPHSKYPVGAALLTGSGEIIAGCNVENASFGLSMCAERSAVFAARSRGLIDPQVNPIRAIAVYAANGAMPWPCGACCQVLCEFGPDSTPVILQGGEGTRELTLGDLLPHAFRLGPRA
ncbi:MAG TPA: cytidine deaminase [bacterium]|nr:cytidine deaminase [bacterium]